MVDLPKLIIVEERAVFTHPHRSKMTCQSCKNMQGCKNNYLCRDFEPINIPGEKPRKGKYLCSGCYNIHYDHGVGLRQSNGKGCWSYGSSSVVLKATPYSSSQRPPWSMRWQLSCYQGKY